MPITVHDYDTAECIREGTPQELAQSMDQAQHDGGAGVITLPDLGDRRVYVME